MADTIYYTYIYDAVPNRKNKDAIRRNFQWDIASTTTLAAIVAVIIASIVVICALTVAVVVLWRTIRDFRKQLKAFREQREADMNDPALNTMPAKV
uniref:Uncharacterized protein n=1 Tax=Globodera rostochiensis TaxID=31243 RepID=A0A914GVT2_GLORO